MLEPMLTYAILGVWSWSLLQFCLVLGAGHRGRKSRHEFSLFYIQCDLAIKEFTKT